MKMQEIIDIVRGFDGSLAVTPHEGSAFPELAWGDAFFFYAPDGIMPERTQPYGTIITKDYPDDERSALGSAGRFRVNIHIGRDRATELALVDGDPARTDALFPHPLYGDAGWVSVVNPAGMTADAVIGLLRQAHDDARVRWTRRAGRR
ncbi:DUF6194 family protein [Microbacterium sp.]|uniref:DUF6194 family protein n=1 Tax=Microbacterium sp. TaxID=51671 RepID=UPI00281102B5|nr:DUF6194 family protein [Microbacterium sp.]